MELRKNLKLIDSSVRRRASISHALAGSAIHVEPFEDISEIRMRWPSSGVILVEDEDDNIAALLDHMTECGNWLPVVGFSQLPTTSRIVRAILDGAVDYLDWPFGAEEIGEAMVEAEKSVASLGNRKLREAMARSRIERLTRREREVLAGVAEGLSNRRIGEQLAISPRTVEIHRANMLTKMGANHTSEAIRIAIEAALVG